MKLTDIINDSNNLIKERIEYIFTAFQKEFSNVRYDERSSIVGIGEPNSRLLCYFKKTIEGDTLVKFKAVDGPVSLMENIENINAYINETVKMFKTNNFLIYSKRAKEKNDYKSDSEVDFTHREFDVLIEEIILTKGEVLIDAVASTKLTNVLHSVGINKISQLKGWSCLKLLEIKKFGATCLDELYYLFTNLKQDKTPEEVCAMNIGHLYKNTASGLIKLFSQKESVKKYLMSINFDENQFESGTVGRFLCLREKVKTQVNLYFCKDDNELHKAYLDNVGKYENLFERTKTLLIYLINNVVQNEKNRDILLSLLSADGEKYTLENLGKRYGITRERVRQIFNRELKRLSHVFDLHSEEGLKYYVLRQNYFSLFETCPVDAFVLFLHIAKQNYVLKALYGALLHSVSVPEDLDDRINIVKDFLIGQKRDDVVTVKDDTVKYNGFQVIVGDDGEVLTDLALLNKLKQERLNLANKLGVPAYWIYHNKHLVVLATFKPLNKKMYSSLRGFTEKTWDDYGSVMVGIIKEHMDSATNDR